MSRDGIHQPGGRVLVLCASAAMAAWPAPAPASLIATQRAACRPGEYVVGLEGRTGAWADAIGPICALWDMHSLVADPPRPANIILGGPGGGRNRQTCQQGSAIVGWTVREIVEGDENVVQNIVARCQALAPSHSPAGSITYAGGGGNLQPVLHQPDPAACPNGEFLTDLNVAITLDGRFVKELSFDCGAAPFIQSFMSSQAGADGSVTYSLPSIKLKDGEGPLLDACREWANDCGQPAADAFCAAMGKANATSFVEKPDAGLTMVISDRRVCNALKGCTAFAHIVCGPKT